jgi:tetratricopeptide (TPR) repeat protein
MRPILVGLLTVCVAARSFGQPSSPSAQPDFARATELYNAASKALTEGRAEEAIRDFTAAHEITQDPVLFFKIGSAYQAAGNCATAINYYQRYLDDAKPDEGFVKVTKERIAACSVVPGAPAPAAAATPAATEPTKPAAPITEPSANKDRAWLFIGGALTFVTAGAVLAYSTSSAEQDIKDLYISSDGMPPEFDEQTRERYENLMDEGRRYEVLAWTSFGLAAACGAAAAIFFMRDEGDVTLTPVVTPKETGVSATLRF